MYIPIYKPNNSYIVFKMEIDRTFEYNMITSKYENIIYYQ